MTNDVRYYNAPLGLALGIDGYRQLIRKFLGIFPDLQLTIEDMVAEGDRVVTRLKGRGTDRGEIMGIAPTEKVVEAEAISIMRFRDGKVAEEWEQIDTLTMLQQLGAVPAPAGAPA